ncbi:MAG: SIMPL domain-containing protein [Burkholderiaceae bacterium]|nr:SIMPL domain-containing protein [Roseateles sp.]MBV8469546.1 SIMPL domain-containing protein [Burkholderiaceae bacterium]
MSAPVLARAGEAPQAHLLNLSASATQEVQQDVLSIRFSASKEGADAAAVKQALQQALDVALNEARKIAKPEAVEVHTGNFAIYPRYSSKNGSSVLNGWMGSAELLVQGRDVAAISQLSGRIGSMNISSVNFSLSRQAREKQEAEVIAEAVAKFKARAQDFTQQFGFRSYQIGVVNVNTDDAGPVHMVQPMMRAMAAPAAASVSDALPVEPGKSTVSVTINGSVQMLP